MPIPLNIEDHYCCVQGSLDYATCSREPINYLQVLNDVDAMSSSRDVMWEAAGLHDFTGKLLLKEPGPLFTGLISSRSAAFVFLLITSLILLITSPVRPTMLYANPRAVLIEAFIDLLLKIGAAAHPLFVSSGAFESR